MVTIEELTCNPDYYIEQSEAEELIAYLRIRKSKEEYVKLGRIRRWKNKKFCSLKETVNYLFLKDRDNEESEKLYCQYCDDPSNRRDNPKRSPELYMDLYDRILHEGYDPKKGIIVVDQFNTILVGLHRACILLHLYGEKSKIPVLKLYCHTSRTWFLPCVWYELRNVIRSMRYREKTESGILR